MPRHSEQRRLRYSPEQMFDLVADVSRYGEFLPWVSAVRVRVDEPSRMVADMVVGFKGLTERFTSEVTKERPGHIHVEYIDGPLRYLRNDWRFRPDGAGTLIEFCVDFQFKSRLFEMLAGQVFDRALRRMIASFETRAAQLYGAPSPAGAGGSGSSSSSAHSAA